MLAPRVPLVRVSRAAFAFALGVFVLLLHANLAFALPITLNLPSPMPQAGRNEAAPARDSDTACEKVGGSVSQVGTSERTAEPGSLLLLGAGLVGAAGLAWRQRP